MILNIALIKSSNQNINWEYNLKNIYININNDFQLKALLNSISGQSVDIDLLEEACDHFRNCPLEINDIINMFHFINLASIINADVDNSNIEAIINRSKYDLYASVFDMNSMDDGDDVKLLLSFFKSNPTAFDFLIDGYREQGGETYLEESYEVLKKFYQTEEQFSKALDIFTQFKINKLLRAQSVNDLLSDSVI